MPTVIAHRGASGHRPEHTLAAYELAAAMGADYLEPDLVITADGVLVARHEPEISGTTDVADHPEFAGRRTTKQLDGQAVTGWFSEDFTLAELKTLRARERIPALRPDNTTYDGAFEVPTFAEVLDLAARTGKGVYPETKHPEFFRAQGLALEEPLADALRGVGVPTFVQSFSADSLRRMRELVDAPLVQLVGLRRPERAAPGGLRRIATYADAIGPAKEHVVP